MYLKGSSIIILGYDITNRRSFERCSEFLEESKRVNEGKSVIVAVGNKIDLVRHRSVSKEEAIKFFEENGVPSDHYFETSAKTGEGVNELFTTAVRIWKKKNQDI